MKMPGRSLLTICWKVKLMNQFRIAPAISTINSMKCAKSSKTPSKLVCFLKILMKVNNKWQICRSQWIKIRPIRKQWGIGEEKKWTISLSSESWVRMLTRRASLLVKKCILNKRELFKYPLSTPSFENDRILKSTSHFTYLRFTYNVSSRWNQSWLSCLSYRYCYL